jgi:hypothetical protein
VLGFLEMERDRGRIGMQVASLEVEPHGPGDGSDTYGEIPGMPGDEARGGRKSMRKVRMKP